MRGASTPSEASGVGRAKGCRVLAGVVALTVGALASQRAAASTAGFWERVAASPRVEADRLLTEAEGLLAAAAARRPAPGTPGARAEALVRRALALVPDDFRGLAALAEVDERAGRADAALADLQRACARASNAGVAGTCWFRVGIERSRRGRFAEAVAAYEQRLAVGAGAGDATVHVNLGESLMALGRLDDADARYREALRLEAPVAVRIEDRHGLLLATYGLAVVLDRAGEAVAAREMMARALSLDPRASQLEAAREPGGDVFFVPEGDVYYYLGLAFEVAERIDDAEAAFQEFGERLPNSPWLGRARAHIATLEIMGRGDERGRAARAMPPLRVTAAGTVLARGPIPAPLVDAAWRQRPGMLDDCFEEATLLVTARQGFRFALELDLDAAGAVTTVVVQAAPPLADLATGPFARCVEAAVRAGLRVSRPRTAKPTHARVELLVGGRE
jgi:tetratricopeptide (TPR) repeat protein